MKPNYSTPTNGPAISEQSPQVMPLLKTETTSAHKQLERVNCFVRLFEPTYTLAEYRELLCQFYGFYSAIEPLIFDGLTETPKSILGHKAKSELLIKDILLLGMDNAQIQHLPRCEKLPQLSSFAQQMGALYVLEGSVLGGRIISKRLKEQFGADIQDKLNFYGCYGENVGTEWKNFQNFMANQFDDKAEDMPEVVAAANATFLALQQWLDK